jgi:hypothetical protein
MRKLTQFFIAAAGLLVLYPSILGILFLTPDSCTNISLTYAGNVLFANNEDTHFSELVLGFYPAGEQGYGSAHVGFRQPDGKIQYGGAMNDKGLAWDLNTAPRLMLNPHPERPFSHQRDNYLTRITKQAASIEEAIRIAQQFDFGDSMAYQLHIADASGDAVVISAGPDGELAFTRKDDGEGYLLLTNFNPANHSEREVDWRYQTAKAMLEEMNPHGEMIFDYTGSVLEAVHLNTLTSYTLYSNIFDLQNRRIYLYYMSQYDEVVVLDLEDELAKGEHVIEMRDLFSGQTAAAGDAAYQRFETRFFTVKMIVIFGGLACFSSGVAFTTNRIRKQLQRDKLTNQTQTENLIEEEN